MSTIAGVLAVSRGAYRSSPLNLDETAVQELQGVTSKIASAFLSMIHVDHLLAGNIIQPLIGGELLVDEACSGVQSLYTLMFIAAFMGVYRYTLLRTSVLVGSRKPEVLS
ncbi:MAG: archaeosortase/exosortase family protein [Planctomycetaceae bacterium]